MKTIVLVAWMAAMAQARPDIAPGPYDTYGPPRNYHDYYNRGIAFGANGGGGRSFTSGCSFGGGGCGGVNVFGGGAVGGGSFGTGGGVVGGGNFGTGGGTFGTGGGGSFTTGGFTTGSGVGFTSGFGGTSLIQKHIYVHVPPPEPEEQIQRQLPQFRSPRKHYKIVFIKTPSPPSHSATNIRLPGQDEQKTLIYVLYKKPDDADAINIQEATPTQPSKPEVYFIKYKTNKQITGTTGVGVTGTTGIGVTGTTGIGVTGTTGIGVTGTTGIGVTGTTGIGITGTYGPPKVSTTYGTPGPY
ncbi:WAG22 antigen-like [Periplaneta americana]|uniref:WAG22 antigen-like n=1 Tax=Periplaneta americana TaxID=6978 RepID=UPI0037E8C87E